MTAPARPRRSALYMPGSNARALEKARALDCDVVILDCEDAVAPAAKAEARAAIHQALSGGGFGHRERIVRINALDGLWGAEDLAALADAAPDALLLPKVRGPEDIGALDAAMTRAGYPENTRIWAMIETPLAVLSARDIAFSSKRLQGFVVGTNDLAKEMRIVQRPGREALLVAIGMIMLAGRAAGLCLLDGVFGDIRDGEGFEAECRQGAMLGFDGKTLIHPSQLEAANAVFRPAPEEVAQARKIVACWDTEAEARGIALLDGRMVERLHVEDARQLLALDAMIAARG